MATLTTQTQDIVEQIEETGPGLWTLDPMHTLVEFSAKHMMISTVKGQFTDVSAQIRLNRDDLTRATVEATIGAASIQTGVEYRDNHLRSGDFLDADSFPHITFKSRAVEKVDEDELKVRGDLTIRGVNGRPKINANGANAMGKGTWVVKGANTVIENVEMFGAKVPDQNGAAIRLDGNHLTLRDSYLHDNENGILTSNDGVSNIVIENSEFASNGYGDGYSHNLYIGRVNSLVFRNSYSHDAKIGHNLKSRANTNTIVYSRFSSSVNRPSYEIDLPNAGTSYIIGNVIHDVWRDSWAEGSPNVGLFLDASASTMLVQDNVIWGIDQTTPYIGFRNRAYVANSVLFLYNSRWIGAPDDNNSYCSQQTWTGNWFSDAQPAPFAKPYYSSDDPLYCPPSNLGTPPEALVAGAPERCFVPPYVGHRGWVGLRLDLPETDWDEVAGCIEVAHACTTS